MQLVSFEISGQQGYGAVVDGLIVRLDTLPGAGADLRSALGANISAQLAAAVGQPRLRLEDVLLQPPITNPGKIICIAGNFFDVSMTGKPTPQYPIVFTRFAESLTGHGQPLILPEVTEKYDFEGELAIVVGKAGHKISKADAESHIAGYACFNDGSVRDWQKHSSQFTPGKNFYRSGSLGPWLVTADEVPDVATLTLRTRVNGVLKQEIGLDRLIFDCAWLISYLSAFTPLAPGDIIAVGTPTGFGSTRNPPEFLAAGDVVEVDIPGVGQLRNVVMRES